jgi:hypothetical protein
MFKVAIQDSKYRWLLGIEKPNLDYLNQNGTIDPK